jgi:hypothetical protein
MVGSDELAAVGRDELADADADAEVADADTLAVAGLVEDAAVLEAGAAEVTGALDSLDEVPQAAVSAIVADSSSTSRRLLDT